MLGASSKFENFILACRKPWRALIHKSILFPLRLAGLAVHLMCDRRTVACDNKCAVAKFVHARANLQHSLDAQLCEEQHTPYMMGDGTDQQASTVWPGAGMLMGMQLEQ